MLASYLGVIIVLSVVVIGGILFTMCRLLLKAAAHGETTRNDCRLGSLLYTVDGSSIAVPIDSFLPDDDGCSECGERHVEKRRTG
jgi:uncharacterized membrane protein YqiK